MISRKSSISIIVILIVVSMLLISIVLLPLIVQQSNRWGEQTTQIDKLHALGFDGSEVIIGIIDTGVDRSHQEFESSSFIAWKDLINDNTGYYDDDDQGTHLAGILVAQGSYPGLLSGVHLQGITPKARLVIVKAIPQNQYLYGGGNDTLIASAIRFCIDSGADIILLSMGMSPEKVNFDNTTQTTEQIQQAIDQGIFVVAPVGNDQQDDDGDVCFPANLEHVIGVGSIDSTNLLSSFSSKGHQYPWSSNPNKKPELVAPGENIRSARINGAYGKMSGTSQAATYVAGILALLLDAFPEFKHDGKYNTNETTIVLVKEILVTTALKIGSLQGETELMSHDDYYGYGLIQGFDAYQQLAQYYGG